MPAGVRPTSGRAREALFSMVGQSLADRRFLDAYGGSGLIGLEAWSRGAEVTVVELKGPVAAAIKRRGAEVGATWTVRTGDVLAIAPSLGRFWGIYVDPPYAADPLPALERLAPLADGWVVVETTVDRELPDAVGGLALDRRRVYGKTVLRVYRR